MKAYRSFKTSFSASILLLALFWGSCSPTRFIPDDQALVTKVTLDSIDERFRDQAGLYVQQDIRPNSRLNLALYNTFNTKRGAYRTDRIRNIGEAPHILDSALVEISRVQIERFLESKGFLKAEVKSDIQIAEKKARLTFTAKPGPEFKIRNIDYVINDSLVRSLYSTYKPSFTRIREGNRYDSDSLAHEREQIFQMMKRNGYYDYLRQYVRFTIDSNLSSAQADLKMYLENPRDKDGHTRYTINDSKISIRTSDALTEGMVPDSSVIDSQFYYKDFSKKFDTERISKYMFIRKGEIYDISKEDLTYDRMYDLNVFKNIKIEYQKTADSTNRLNPVYDIVPLKRMSNRVEGEYTFNSDRNGFNIGDTYTDRNLFGGAEQLEVKLRYGLLFDAGVEAGSGNRLFSRDFQLGANLIIPRLLVPFNVPSIGKFGVPHTTISSSAQIFDQKDVFRNKLYINSITYDWLETRFKQHRLTPLNFEYRKGVLEDAVIADLVGKGFGLYVATNDREYFNLGSQYSYTFNALRLNQLDKFVYFRGIADVGGNTLGLFSKIFGIRRDAVTGEREIFGLPYLQYGKFEFDVRKYMHFKGERQLVLRINPGFAIPYGNTTELPYEKNFYAGGSTGNRAWQARTLGPGRYNRSTITSENTRSNLRGLDQLGEIKFEGNAEYRFKIADNFFSAKLKGAAFTDFGNIWRNKDNTLNGEAGVFRGDKFLNELAIGVGGGLRFDVEYFVFRFDVGVKVRDPQFAGKERWVLRHLFDKDFKEAFKATHSPDIYRFVQYNFGIGLPF